MLQISSKTKHLHLTMLLSFGLNDRTCDNPRILKESTFPLAKVYIQMINYSNSLTPTIQSNLTTINNIITLMENHIPKLEQSLFQTEKKGLSFVPTPFRHTNTRHLLKSLTRISSKTQINCFPQIHHKKTTPFYLKSGW